MNIEIEEAADKKRRERKQQDMVMFTIPLQDLIRHKTWDVARLLWDREKRIKEITPSYLTVFDCDSKPTISYYISADANPLDEFRRVDAIVVKLEYFRLVGFNVSYKFNERTALSKNKMIVDVKFALKDSLATKIGFADKDLPEESCVRSLMLPAKKWHKGTGIRCLLRGSQQGKCRQGAN